MRALLPLIFFLAVYVGLSVLAGDFYAIPVTVAFMLTAIVAVALSRGTLKHRIKVFSRGSGTGNILLMIWIFILAGAFAHSAREMGSVDDVVNLMLGILPGNMVMAGLFLAAAVISLSIGTSVGTIVALMPIAVTMAHTMNESVPFIAAIVIGGSFFGDNLSFISDTTVCATQSQGCKMSDKFRTNIRIAAPAAIILFVAYAVMGWQAKVPTELPEVDYLKVVPYLTVLLTAIMGMNVLLVLVIGIALSGIVGMVSGDYSLLSWMKVMGDGIMGMGELIIVTMLAGGVLEMIRTNGGIRYLMNRILRHVHSPRSAELSIAALVSATNVCTANNTVAIITVAGIAKDISHKYGLDPRRVASILDTFSCIVQGILPYGAQLLMGAALAGISPLQIIPYLYYPLILAIFALANIVFNTKLRIEN